MAVRKVKSDQSGVSLQIPKTSRQQNFGKVPEGNQKEQSTAVRPSRMPHFLAVFFGLSLGYICFTIGTMVPQARTHFFELLIHPAPAHFFKAG
jgi:hypothetical protein